MYLYGEIYLQCCKYFAYLHAAIFNVAAIVKILMTNNETVEYLRYMRKCKYFVT